MNRRAKIILANLHATSNPAIVLPWLLAICLARGVDAVLLQECTARHARWLRRLPRWDLVRAYGDEAILIRRRKASARIVVRSLGKGWFGKHTGEPHKPRTIPAVVLDGWLWLASVHGPPGWLDGPQDRQDAGEEYLDALGALTDVRLLDLAEFLGGDWNALPYDKQLVAWRKAHDLNGHGWGIDHAAFAGCRVIRRRALGRARGMDHGAWLYVVEQVAR